MLKINWQALRRFTKYATIGVGTFGLDISLLYLLTKSAHVPYAPATFASFLLAVSVNYFLSRKYVFLHTNRSLQAGYLNMIIAALAGATLTTAFTVLLVQVFAVQYLMARILVSAKVGFGNYLFNLYLNFRVAGKHNPHATVISFQPQPEDLTKAA